MCFNNMYIQYYTRWDTAFKPNFKRKNHDRDAQFHFTNKKRKGFRTKGRPTISISVKKKRKVLIIFRLYHIFSQR